MELFNLKNHFIFNFEHDNFYCKKNIKYKINNLIKI